MCRGGVALPRLIFVFVVGDRSPSSIPSSKSKPSTPFGVAPTVSPSSTCARRSGPSTSLLRRADGRLDRVRRRGAALGDLALGQFGGLVDGLHRDLRRVHSELLGDGVDLLGGLRLRGGGGLVDLRGRRGFGLNSGKLR